MTDSIVAQIGQADPRGILVWTGAGISAEPPASLPLGDFWTKTFIDGYTLPGTWDRLTSYFDLFRVQDESGRRKSSPRFEIVLSHLVSVLGAGVLSELSPAASADPNRNHLVLARHLAHGGRQVTTNFDTCIERVLESRHWLSVDALSVGGETRIKEDLGALLHLHGSITSDDSLASLGVQLPAIVNGLSLECRQMLRRWFAEATWAVFAGYSGRDFFDINPFFRVLATEERLPNLHVVWLKHKDIDGCEIFPDWIGHEGAAILKHLQKAGARVTYIQGRVSELLERIGDRWSATGRPAPLDALPRSADPPRANVSYGERVLATAQIWSGMGIGREGATLAPLLMELSGNRRQQALTLAGNAMRDVGRYARATRINRRLSRRTIPERIQRHHRLAGDYWLGGRMFRASFHFFMIERRFSTLRSVSTRRESISEYLEAQVTFLHFGRDARKTPLAFLLASRSRMRKAYSVRREKLIAGYADPHARAKLVRIQALHNWIGEPPADLGDEYDYLLDFAETDSLFGIINFRRTRLLEKQRHDDSLSPKEVEDLWELHRWSSYVGDNPGIFKAAWMLGKARQQMPQSAFTSLGDCEFSLSLRFQWLVRLLRAR